MKTKIYLFITLMLLPAMLIADNGKKSAVAMLDKAVEAMRADAGLHMDFTYRVYDADGDVLCDDKGYFCLDKNNRTNSPERYTLQMQQLRVWCNGERQWNYMAQTNEIYITSVGSDEAQNLSPLHLMQLYKSGHYDSSYKVENGTIVVTLRSIDEAAEFSEIKVYLSKENLRLVSLAMTTTEGNRAEIAVDSYKSKCTFDNKVFECPVNEYPDAEVIDML